MSEIAAPAQPAAPTSEETVKPAPASGTEKQDTDLTGSGEVTVKHEKVATREKPEEIESPEEWLKNAQALNEKITTNATPDGETPPAEAAPNDPPAAEAPPVEATPPVESPEAAEPPEEPEVPGQPKKLPQHRIRADDPVDDMALSLFNASRRNGGKMTLTEATREAQRMLGKTETPAAAPVVTAPATAQAPEPRADGRPATIADTEAQIVALRAKRKDAFATNANLDETDELTNQIEDLLEHKRTLREEQQNAVVRQRETFETEAQMSQARAVEMYPDCKVKDSPLVKEMIALDEEWKQDGNALYHSANKPFLLAQRATERLKRAGLLKETPAAPAASPQPVKPARPVQPAAPVASAAARTTQAPTQNGQLVEELNKINSVADYEKAMRKLGVPISV